MSNTLYLCYFGLHEPLVQTQVLPYLREISKMENLRLSLLTFEPNFRKSWTKDAIEAEREKLAADNIRWHALGYHKRPSALATAFDVLNGARMAITLSGKEKIDIIHARSHVPMLMALIVSKFTGSKLIFDFRGLMAEEYADAGIWRENSIPFRLVKYVERVGFKRASQVVVLTKRMRNYLVENNLKKKDEIEVVPCCVDFSRIYRAEQTEKNERFELIYAGSATGLYLLSEMGRFFLELKRHEPDAFFRVLTASPPDGVRKIFRELGIGENDYVIARVAPADVPGYLRRAHLGVSFRKPAFSQIAASPTKIPEYLAAGLPVVSNSGIGDKDRLIRESKLGVIVKSFDEPSLKKAALEAASLLEDKEISERCVNIAIRNFDLRKTGKDGYLSVYQRIQKTLDQ